MVATNFLVTDGRTPEQTMMSFNFNRYLTGVGNESLQISYKFNIGCVLIKTENQKLL